MTQSQGREEYPTCNLKKWKANWIGHILLRNFLLQHIIEVRGTDKGDGKTRKKT
jgi:hypothetical protein